MKNIIVCILLVVFAIGCTNVGRSELAAYGKNFKIEVFSGGQIVRTYISDGKVLTENTSDGWRFRDRESGKYIRVSGTSIVTEL